MKKAAIILYPCHGKTEKVQLSEPDNSKYKLCDKQMAVNQLINPRRKFYALTTIHAGIEANFSLYYLHHNYENHNCRH